MNATPPADTAELKLLVKGFNATEHRLLEAMVTLSRRRPPRIVMLDAADTAQADVLLLDAQDPQVLQWAAAQPGLVNKPIIWAGARVAHPSHMVVDRHVKWPILPVLLYRAMELHGSRAATPASAAQAPQMPTRRVLVIDDSIAARVHARQLLERHGLEVTEADTAEAGIAAATEQSFAFALLDVLMPGMDGFEACRRIKAKARAGQHLPVVMLTSKSSPFDRVRGKMAGCDTYLTKPVDPAQLQEVVMRHTGHTPAAAGARTASGFTPLQPQAI